MASTDWSTAAQDIIDTLVSYIKRAKLWRRVGPRLRLLNKYWCSVLNVHIVDIGPHSSRQLSEADIDSLSKFQNLNKLHAAPFEKAKGIPWIEACRRIASAISKTPRLTMLCVARLMEGLDRDAQKALDSVKELIFEGEVDLNSVLDAQALGVEKLSGTFDIGRLNVIMSRMRSLKVLQIDKGTGGVDAFESFGSLASHLEAISFTMPINWFAQDSLNKLKNLVSLEIVDGHPSSLKSLTAFGKLTHLSFSVASKNVLTTSAFVHVAMQLVSLKMQCLKRRVICPESFLTEATRLQTLSLRRFVVNELSMKNLQRCDLKELSLIQCGLPDETNQFQNFTTLTMLAFKGVWNPPCFRDLLVPLQNLRSLSLISYSYPRTDLLNEIARLSSLESLEIGNSEKYWTSDADYKCMETMTGLRSLCLTGWSGLSDLEDILEIEVIHQLEELILKGRVKSDRTEGAFLDALKAKAPDLRVKLESPV